MDSNLAGRTRLALHNCHINIKVVAEEFCLEYEPCPEQCTDKKTVFIVRGEQALRREFVAAIKERLEVAV